MFLRKLDPKLYHQEKDEQKEAALQLTYFGTAGFRVENAEHTLVIDPYITRPGLWTTAFRRLVPNKALIEATIPHADDVLIGHAHFDHILDAPHVCHHTGARLIGSPSACQVGRAAGLPESQLVETVGREDIRSGPAVVRGLPSRHGKIYGRIPLPGKIEEPPAWPPRYRALRCGLVLNWHITMAGLRIVHIDSADFVDEELDGLQADVVCLCAVGRQSRPNYVETVVEKLKPRYILPCHWDWFFTPYHKEPKCLPGVDIPGFIREIEAVGVTPIVLPFGGTFGVEGS